MSRGGHGSPPEARSDVRSGGRAVPGQFHLPAGRCLLLAGLALLLSLATVLAGEKGKSELEQLRQVLPPCPTFDRWIESFGYLPPDFDALPAAPSLDWHHPPARLAQAVKTARFAYRTAGRLELYIPDSLAEFNNDIQDHLLRFFKNLP